MYRGFARVRAARVFRCRHRVHHRVIEVLYGGLLNDHGHFTRELYGGLLNDNGIFKMELYHAGF